MCSGLDADTRWFAVVVMGEGRLGAPRFCLGFVFNFEFGLGVEGRFGTWRGCEVIVGVACRQGSPLHWKGFFEATDLFEEPRTPHNTPIL